MSDLELKNLQSVRVWIQKFTVLQILQKTMQSRNHILFRSILYNWEIVAGFVLFKELDFEFNYFIVSESDTKNYKVSDFEMKKNACQILKMFFWN